MVSLAVRIMAHSKRESLVSALVERLGITGDDVAWDEVGSPWDTGRRAWLSMIDSGADWGLVIQDDAIVCRDLVAGTSTALDHVPDDGLVALFNVTGMRETRGYRLIRQTVERADREEASWIAMKTLMCGVALAMPIRLIEDVIAWCDRQRWPEYDRRIGQYYLRHRLPVYSTHPSLVEHRDGESSLVGHAVGRVAHRFIGEEASALDNEWSGPVVSVPGARRTRVKI